MAMDECDNMNFDKQDPIEREQGLLRLLKDGFFDDVNLKEPYVENNGRLNLVRLYELWSDLRGRKYAMKYFLMQGDLLPSWGTPPRYKNPEEAEKLYKKCLENGTTWRKLTGYKDDETVLY